jgi:hypothetical protein
MNSKLAEDVFQWMLQGKSRYVAISGSRAMARVGSEVDKVAVG